MTLNAQDLKQLFFKAYLCSRQGSKEAEEMGRTVLTCQFVTGLFPSIKEKLIGHEGSFEELLSKARFEEVKQRELSDGHFNRASNRGHDIPNIKPSTKVGNTFQKGDSKHPTCINITRRNVICYTCGMAGHISKDCQFKGRFAPVESRRGRLKTGSSRSQVATVHVGNEETEFEEPIHSRQEADALEQALENVDAILHNVTVKDHSATPGTPSLGPSLSAKVKVEGTEINALIDTGSPVSIVSLDKFLTACAIKKCKKQLPGDWEVEMRAKFKPPNVSLKNYSGGEISLVGTLHANVARDSYMIEAPLQVQAKLVLIYY